MTNHKKMLIRALEVIVSCVVSISMGYIRMTQALLETEDKTDYRRGSLYTFEHQKPTSLFTVVV